MFRSVVVVFLSISCARAFQVRPQVVTLAAARTRTPIAALHLSSSSEDGNNTAPRRRKRVKRKEPIATPAKVESSEATKEVEAPVPDLKPRDDAPVELQIKDVREVVSGKPSVSTPQADGGSFQSSSMNVGGESSSADSNDALQQLLADAKAMRSESSDVGDKKEQGDASIKETVQNVLSTIVTIDFFVVCALLLWFLAGIFGSVVLGNDAVQIAFNGIFEKVVQPALGVLMLGSAASAVLKEEGED